MRKTKMITISLLPEFLEKVNQIAKEENRTRSELLREALRCYMEERERKQAFGELDRIWEKTKDDDPEWIEQKVNEAVRAVRNA